MGLSHPRSAQQASVDPNIPEIHIPSAQVNPLPHQQIIMAAWYAPLVLPQPLVPLPNYYQSKIPNFTAKEFTTAQHHVDRMEDSFDYMEIDDDTVKMRIFAQSLGGDVKKWFKSLPPNNIQDLPALYQTFINKWEVKANPLQILAE